MKLTTYQGTDVTLEGVVLYIALVAWFVWQTNGWS